jgi:hypothetical protein
VVPHFPQCPDLAPIRARCDALPLRASGKDNNTSEHACGSLPSVVAIPAQRKAKVLRGDFHGRCRGGGKKACHRTNKPAVGVTPSYFSVGFPNNISIGKNDPEIRIPADSDHPPPVSSFEKKSGPKKIGMRPFGGRLPSRRKVQISRVCVRQVSNPEPAIFLPRFRRKVHFWRRVWNAG